MFQRGKIIIVQVLSLLSDMKKSEVLSLCAVGASKTVIVECVRYVGCALVCSDVREVLCVPWFKFSRLE